MNAFESSLDDVAQASPLFAAVLQPIEKETQDLLLKAATQTENPYARSCNQLESHLKRAQESLYRSPEARI